MATNKKLGKGLSSLLGNKEVLKINVKDNKVPIFEVKLLVPFLIGEGNLLYPFATGSRTISSKAMLNLKTALLVFSKHSSADFALEIENIAIKIIGIKIFKFLITNILAIYIILTYILGKI